MSITETAKADCETRRAIVQAARSRFLHYGYKKTTIEEIAADAGVGKGTVYLYFASKEQILFTLVREVKQNVTAQMRCIADSIATPEEKLKRILWARIRSIHDAVNSTAHGIEMVDEISRPEIGGCTGEENRIQRQILAAVLADGVRQGVFRVPDNDVDAAANHLMLAFVSFLPPNIASCHNDTRCIVSLQKRVEAMLEFVLYGIRNTGS